MNKGKIEPMATKFSENFVGVALLIWMSHPFLKNLPDTYETPCTSAIIAHAFPET